MSYFTDLGSLFILNALVDFFSMYAYIPRCAYANANLITFDAQYGY